MARITLSYRRSDSDAITGRIFDRLVAYYGADAVFRDIDNIPPGIDFRKYIGEALNSTEILLGIVGPQWAGRRPDGSCRLNEDTDLVRIEVETALRKNIPVIPVLVHNASMPQEADLPDGLQEFAFRHAVRVDAREDFDQHIKRLILSLDRLLQNRTLAGQGGNKAAHFGISERAAADLTGVIAADSLEFHHSLESKPFALVFTDFARQSVAWERMPRTRMLTLVAEYRHLAQSIGGQYGRRYEQCAGDGYLLFFESADAAIHFALRLIAYWKQRRRSLIGDNKALDLPIQVGCHFGECTRLTDAEAWIGRAINLAKQVQSMAEPDTLLITQAVLDLVDLPIYEFREGGRHKIKGDILPERPLYRLLSVNLAALLQRPASAMTAEDWFLKGVEMAQRECNERQEVECYQKAIQLRRNYPEAHNNLAILFKATGEEESAECHYKEALYLWPEYPEAHYNYAILLESMGDQMGAQAHYEQALRNRRDYSDARLRYAGVLASNGDTLSAGREYQEVLRMQPGYPEAHNNYAIFLESEGNRVDAERQYLKALELNPNYPQAHYNYAMLLEHGDRDRALAHYRRAVTIVPTYAEAHNNLAILLHENGDLLGAEAHYRTALRLRPGDPEINYNFALLSQAKGDKEEAERYFRISKELALASGKSRAG